MVLKYIRIREASVKAVESEEKQDQPMTIERACKNGSVPEEESSGVVT
jgi:hypothetical protein